MWVWPDSELLASAARSGGGSVVTLEQANAIVCTGDDVELLRRSILPGVRWVQLGAAGVEMWFDAGLMTPGRRLDVRERCLRETDRRARPCHHSRGRARPAHKAPSPERGGQAAGVFSWARPSVSSARAASAPS